MALTYDNALVEAFKKAVEERQLKLAIDLINARQLEPDWYRGVYWGLAEAITLLDEEQKKLEER